MPHPLLPLIDTIRMKDYQTATEGITQVLQQKVAERLTQERTEIGKTLVKESAAAMACSKCGSTEDGPRTLYHRRVFCLPCANKLKTAEQRVNNHD